ncbi:MAG TPA: 3'-5' exonuclease [Prolixibacteraceae bacterium]|nr:3'-5' exonuclease [Prolixibacteraceae bacterium]
MYAIIDIETTGQSALKGKITEIAIFIHDGTEIVESFSSLVNPECYIPQFITDLTGISNDMVKRAPKFYEIARKIVEITQDKIFVGHNVQFDYRFVQEEFKRLGYDYQRQTMCTVRLGRKFIPGHRSYSLGNICEELGISINGRHRAAGDAYATTKLFEIIMEKKRQKETRIPPGQLKLF